MFKKIQKNNDLHIIFKKICTKLYKILYHRFYSIFPSCASKPLKFINLNNYHSDMVFIFDNFDKNFYDHFVKSDVKKHKNILDDADRVLAHKFNLLGSGECHLCDKIQWSVDFKSGYKWDQKYYKYIKFINLEDNSDVKVPWELSRFQHLLTLGKAYLLSKNENYALEFKNQIEDWICENPYLMTVNWACTMDVAIRAVNWILGYYFFQNSKSIDNTFIKKFSESLYLHGVYIINNLENHGGHTGNHYLSDIVGLVWLGMYFKTIKPSNKKRKLTPEYWLKFGMSELEKEMQVQVNEDGTHYETSTSYHRLVTELFLITCIALRNNCYDLSSTLMNKLEKMCEFIMHIIKPDGTSPIIGDADDGRFIILSDYYSWKRNDFRHILAIAGELFDRDDFRISGLEFTEDALLATGKCKYLKSKATFLADSDILKLSSTSFEHGGYYILRNDRIHCTIRCGELALRGHGGHSHNDQLSFELNIDGVDIVIDPGMYVYTSDYKMRNLFRSTKYHNTIVIEGYEQNDFDELNLFRLEEQTFAKCIEFTNNKFVGRHYGYKKKCDIVHERTFELHNDKIVIKDNLIGPNATNLEWFSNLVLNKGIDPVKSSEFWNLTVNDKTFLLLFDTKMPLKIASSYFSKAYGTLEKCKTLSIKTDTMTIGAT